MNKTDARRRIIIGKVADHLLAHGLRKASLRPLAKAAGTSDRMLMHYFGNKEQLLTQALALVTERLVELLESAQSKPMPFSQLIHHLAALIRDSRVRPYLRLWLELAASAAQGEEAHGSIARRIGDVFWEWTAKALKVAREKERQPMASLAFATIEGMVLLDAIDCTIQIDLALKAVAMRGQTD